MGSKAPSRVRIPPSPPVATGHALQRWERKNSLTKHRHVLHNSAPAPVAQLDRAPGYELGGREFESLRARHTNKKADAKASAFLFVGARRANARRPEVCEANFWQSAADFQFPALPRAPFTKRGYDSRRVIVIPAEAGIHAARRVIRSV